MVGLRDVVSAMALRLYAEKGIKTECEECFYLTDPECPSFPHVCALEHALGDPEERIWVAENLLERVEMRRRFVEGRVEA